MNFEIAGSHISHTRSLTPATKSPAAPAPPTLSDSTSVGSKSSPKLNMEEHNLVQLDLMRKMGVDPKNQDSMFGWIIEHAGRFRDVVESDAANGLRQQLRQPEGRAGALASLQELLLKEPEGK